MSSQYTQLFFHSVYEESFMNQNVVYLGVRGGTATFLTSGELLSLFACSSFTL